MIEMKAMDKDGIVIVSRKIRGNGEGEAVLKEGLGIIESLVSFYADIIEESKQDVLRELTKTLMHKLQNESVSDDKNVKLQ